MNKVLAATASALALGLVAHDAQAALVVFQGTPATSFADGVFSTGLSGGLPDGFYSTGTYSAFNSYGQNREYIKFNAPVRLDSLSIGLCNTCLNTNPASFTINLYDISSVLIGSTTVSASSTPELVTLDTSGVHKIEFTFPGGDGPSGKNLAWYEVSNISYSLGVPEPAAWALMILGFGAVGVALRRRRLQPA